MGTMEAAWWFFFYQKQMLVGGWPKKWCSLFHEVSHLNVRFFRPSWNLVITWLMCTLLILCWLLLQVQVKRQSQRKTGRSQGRRDHVDHLIMCAILNEDKRLLSTKLHLALIRCKTKTDSQRYWSTAVDFPAKKIPGGVVFLRKQFCGLFVLFFARIFPKKCFPD